MGLFIKILLLLLVLAIASLFVLKGPDGQPLMTLDDIQKPEAWSELPASIASVKMPFQGDEVDNSASPKPAKQKLYSWKDERGNIHYSDIAPSSTDSVKVIQVDSDINVIRMEKSQEVNE